MFILYFIWPLLWVCVNSGVYDQRQTGDLNIQIDVKDVRFFAVMKGNKEEYVDYDYAYDYSELTIKPQNRTTPKPFNRTRTTQQTIAIQNSTITPIILQNNFTEASITTVNFIDATNVSDIDFTTIKYTSESMTRAISEMNVAVTPTSSPTIKNCKRGFVLNQKGDCQLRQNNTENALMKLVKLSQKLKLRRGNKSNVST